MSDAKYSTALGELRSTLARFKQPGQTIYNQIVAPREEVFAKYRPLFSLGHLASLTREEFTSFLYFENNRHWTGLHRQGLGAAADMAELRRSLEILLDESRPIRERFPEALSMVSGFGKATATSVLTVAYPDKYGVWNNTSEAGVRQVGLWPRFGKGDGIGARYDKINSLLVRLSSDLGVDLWTLDALWWYLLEAEEPPAIAGIPGEAAPLRGSFILEQHLEEFLLGNWDRTPLSNEWTIFRTPDDPEAGNQFPTDVGRIDILAVHKEQPRFLVVELKRNQTSDQAVGQVLRYVGWVKRHLARDGQQVEALIIAHTAEKDVQYAIFTLPNVSIMTYELEFHLKKLEPLPALSSE